MLKFTRQNRYKWGRWGIQKGS